MFVQRSVHESAQKIVQMLPIFLFQVYKVCFAQSENTK